MKHYILKLISQLSQNPTIAESQIGVITKYTRRSTYQTIFYGLQSAFSVTLSLFTFRSCRCARYARLNLQRDGRCFISRGILFQSFAPWNFSEYKPVSFFVDGMTSSLPVLLELRYRFLTKNSARYNGGRTLIMRYISNPAKYVLRRSTLSQPSSSVPCYVLILLNTTDIPHTWFCKRWSLVLKSSVRLK